jgi:hypothetical protein
MNSYSELKADIAKLSARLQLVQGQASPLVTALGNWVSYAGRAGSSTTRQPLPSAQTAPALTCVLAAALKATQTGIFEVKLSIGFNSNTSGDIVLVQLVGLQSSGAGVIGPGGSFTAAGISGANASNPSSGVLGADAAGGTGLTFDGTPLNTPTATYGSNSTTGTTVTAQQAGGGNAAYAWSFAGKVSASPTTKTKVPFTIGNNVCFGVLLQGTNVDSIGHASLDVTEWPYG